MMKMLATTKCEKEKYASYHEIHEIHEKIKTRKDAVDEK